MRRERPGAPGREPGQRLLLRGHPRAGACASRGATPAGCSATRPALRVLTAGPSTAASSSRGGEGTVFSYLVHHAPQVPGKEPAAGHRPRGPRRGRADGGRGDRSRGDRRPAARGLERRRRRA
ncbi:hypothetical protein [Nocardioides convexus]|uniref:hypothetical protein n=1 Tax=Nocardioides convexus TaxID=2712224 RepID=UPI0024183EC9|nr:hypothetical protein [Nocardioides convexus]